MKNNHSGDNSENPFEALGLSPESLAALTAKGFSAPTEIQAKIIPRVLAGAADIIGQAQTGTGKTAAFGLPILDLLAAEVGGEAPEADGKWYGRFKTKPPRALILTPTRELAIQVAAEIESLRGGRNLSVLPVYGGQYIGRQLEGLKKGVDIVVGTPGRVIDHLERGTLVLSAAKHIVLDEADEMLAMGFIEDISRILESVPAERRTLLFSATMPEAIRRVAETYMGEYELVRVKKSTETVEMTRQIYFMVREEDKLEALCRLVDKEEAFYGLVFCRTRTGVDSLVRKLQERGYPAEGLHGDMGQAQRELILGRFRKKRLTLLAATDVAARGIDIGGLSFVVNYSLPTDTESYIHRIGRTGRAGRAGTAISFVTPGESRMLSRLKNATRAEIRHEEIPSVEEVLAAKKERIFAAVWESPAAGAVFREMADALLSGGDKPAQEILAAVLAKTFGGELDAGKYGEVKVVKKKESPQNAVKKKREKADGKKGNEKGKFPVKEKTARGKSREEKPKEKEKSSKAAKGKGGKYAKNYFTPDSKKNAKKRGMEKKSNKHF